MNGLTSHIQCWEAVEEARQSALGLSHHKIRSFGSLKDGLHNLGASGPMLDSDFMKQMSLVESGFERKTKWTRKREFLDETNLAVPWGNLVFLINPGTPAPGAKGGRPAFAVVTMLRAPFVPQ